MNSFIHNLELVQLLIPAVCSGMLIISFFIYLYIYRQTRENSFFSLSLLGLIAFIYTGSELFTLIFGGLFNNNSLGLQFYRIEQVSASFFIFALPFLLTYQVEFSPRWKRINRIICITGLAVSIIILLFAYIFPDIFISVTRHSEVIKDFLSRHIRGKEGFLYIVRDVVLSLLIIYTLVCYIIDLLRYRKYVILLLIIGTVFAVFGAIDDSVYIYTGMYTGLFSQLYFSRFSLGISLCLIFIMSGTIKRYINQAQKEENAYIEIDSAYRALHNSEERFRQLAEHINEIFLIHDYINKVVLYASPAYERIWGSSCQSLYESPLSWLEAVHPEDKKEAREALEPRENNNIFELIYRIISTDKSTRWIKDQIYPIMDKNGKIYRIVRILHDVTKSKQSEEKLSFLAYHDTLTNLPNKKSFYERFKELLIQARREKQAMSKALVFIDIDKFKNINNTFGHIFGDKLIIEISNRLRQCLRESDYIYRFAGDEFTVILNNVADDLDAGLVAKKIIDTVSMPYHIEEQEIFLGLCIGISIYPKDGDNIEDLIQKSAIALHNAKHEKNAYRFFNKEMNAEAIERVTIENNLRYAIERNQLFLHYQPFVNISGEITGMEALIRWQHPEMGFIPPDRFIKIAESGGHIVKIGYWVLKEACSQLKRWQEAGYDNIRIAVNLSVLQFMDENLVENVIKVINQTNLEPKFVELEITESSVIENTENAINKINKLHETGISVSIDDFGTGYSSLSKLKRFKIDNLKIDRSFIKDIIVDENNTEITKAIIAMAHNLNLCVIAEGVEKFEQKEFLKSLRCDEMQGYLFSKPLPAEEFEKLLEKGIIKK